MPKWKSLDSAKIKAFCENQYNRYKEYPSVREIFYGFIDELWPNTLSTYQGLSKYLRDKRLKGEVPWRFIRDGSGRELMKGDSDLIDPSEFADFRLTDFLKSSEYYSLPQWLRQDYKVIVVCEKEADFPVIGAILRYSYVDISFQRGYSGWDLIHKVAVRFSKFKASPVLIIIGDFDPSGQDITRFFGESVKRILSNNLQVEKSLEVLKIAVTKEQVEKFDLPHRPEDEKEIQKMRRDPRFKKWPHGLYRVETASLRIREPEYFENLLVETVKKYFDNSIYEEVLEEEVKKRAEVERKIKSWVRRPE